MMIYYWEEPIGMFETFIVYLLARLCIQLCSCCVLSGGSLNIVVWLFSLLTWLTVKYNKTDIDKEQLKLVFD